MMTATACPSQHVLQAFTSGRLEDAESMAVFEHLQHCPECQAEIETLDDDVDSLIQDLRADDEHAGYRDEPECQNALAKALGALVKASESAPAHAESLDLPEQLGEYEIVRQIGRGGMGRVFLARHTKLGREVALKIIADHRLTDPKVRHRFDAEMKAVGRLSHPNIVTAYDAREVEGLAVLVTEYIDGKNLHEILADTGPLSLANASAVIARIAAALQYTSEQGFVHRDVKPSNIMISRSGEVKLLDMGLARFQSNSASELTASGQTIGTADYVSPEQVTDGRNADTRSDVYSLGCTLLKLLTGRAPYEDANHVTTFSKLTAHVSSPPPNIKSLIPDHPGEVARLLDRMLQKSPHRRPQSPGEVAKALSRFAEASDLKELIRRADTALSPTAPLPHPPPAAATQPWLHRRVPRSVALASSLFGLIAGLLVGMFLKVTYPDGTEVTLPIGPGSKVEFVTEEAASRETPTPAREAFSNANPSPSEDTEAKLAPATADQIADALQGVWRLKPLLQSDATGQTPPESNAPTSLVYFDGFEFCIATADSQNESLAYGTFALQRDTTVTLALRFESSKTIWSAQLHTINPPVSPFVMTFRPGRTDPDANILGLDQATLSRPLQVHFERLGNVPKNPGDLRPMMPNIVVDNKDPYLKSLMLLTQARTLGPKQLLEQSANARSSAEISRSRNNLKQIAIAFHNFHDAYRKLPGSKNVLEGARRGPEQNVQPFSWRVALLPFLGENELYESYRFDEPWDSPNNSKLLEKMPAVYRNPRAKATLPSFYTNYLGLTSAGALMEKEGGIPFREITDGTSNTVLVVESRKSVPWTKPDDLEEFPSFFSPAIWAMADGSVRTEETFDRETMQKMITYNGGEDL